MPAARSAVASLREPAGRSVAAPVQAVAARELELGSVPEWVPVLVPESVPALAAELALVLGSG